MVWGLLISLRMAELDDRYVKTGLWTNWANGPFWGRTVTTDIRTGTIIVSLLALLASLATTHLWHVLVRWFICQDRLLIVLRCPRELC